MSKMLSAGVAMGENRNVTLDLDIVDVQTGLLRSDRARHRSAGQADGARERAGGTGAARAGRRPHAAAGRQRAGHAAATRRSKPTRCSAKTFGGETESRAPAPHRRTSSRSGAGPSHAGAGSRTWWSFPAAAWAGEEDQRRLPPSATSWRATRAALSARNVDHGGRGASQAQRHTAEAGHLLQFNARDLQVHISDVDIDCAR